MPLDDNLASYFRGSLLSWFRESARVFPWREDRDPFHMLVAEKLLQQTAASKQVVDTFVRFVREFPTPLTLARAHPGSLEALIEPLGFRYRARELQALAAVLVSRFRGEIPRNERDLISLPGVGEYIARAVLSFGFGFDLAVVDINVARILFRFFAIPSPFPSNPARNPYLREMAQALLPAGRAREFNWAMLDLGALVCRPRKPRCFDCPLMNRCVFSKS